MAKIYLGTSDVKKSSVGNTAVAEFYFAPVANPILANNTWEEIQAVALRGATSNYWAVGDTKDDVGNDSTTRTFRIVEIENDGSIMFEQVELEDTGVVWNPQINNYYISDIRNIVLPNMILKYSSSLQSIIVTTNVKVATNGINGTLLTLTDKLFLEAEKEIWTVRTCSRTEEFNSLNTFAYWLTHTTNADHIKYQNNTAYGWWLRSPYSDSDSTVCCVQWNGKAGNSAVYNYNRFAPCFRIGTAQTGGLGLYVDPVLTNNSWNRIKAMSEAGLASSFWSVGDTKTDAGADGVTRTFRIVDMSGLYGKHVVFEQVEIEGNDGVGTVGVQWDDSDNDYSSSNMNVTVLPGFVSNRLSSKLADALTNTTVKVAENGNSSTIVDVTNKLFLEAEKEVGLTGYSVTAEANALTTYAYYITHNQASDRVKYDQANSAYSWWLRSPNSSGNYAVFVNNSGNNAYSGVNNFYRFAPCFAF